VVNKDVDINTVVGQGSRKREGTSDKVSEGGGQCRSE